jgi:hypothetical protein
MVDAMLAIWLSSTSPGLPWSARRRPDAEVSGAIVLSSSSSSCDALGSGVGHHQGQSIGAAFGDLQHRHHADPAAAGASQVDGELKGTPGSIGAVVTN